MSLHFEHLHQSGFNEDWGRDGLPCVSLVFSVPEAAKVVSFTNANESLMLSSEPLPSLFVSIIIYIKSSLDSPERYFCIRKRILLLLKRCRDFLWLDLWVCEMLKISYMYYST